MSDDPFSAFKRRLGRGLRGVRGRDRIVEELLDHLEQAAAEEERGGADEAAAKQRAVDRFGDVETIAAAFPEARRYWLAAVVGVAGAIVLAVLTARVAGQVARPCGGAPHVFCASTLPVSAGVRLHPLRAALNGTAAVSAVLLAAGFAMLAWRIHRRRRRMFGALVARALGENSHIAELTQPDEPHRPSIRALAVGAILLGVIIAAVGADVRSAFVSFHTPRQSAIPLQRVHEIPTRAPTIVGDSSAKPLLRALLHRMPTDFATVGVGPLKIFGDHVLITTSPKRLAAGESAEISWETQIFAWAYQHAQRQPPWRHAPPISAAQSDEGGGRLDRRAHYYTPTSRSALRHTIGANARRIGLVPVWIELPEPDGVAPIMIARESDPSRGFDQFQQLLPKERFIGSLLIVESNDGYVHAIFGTLPNGGLTWSATPHTPHLR